jgi:hypothetical protein
MTISAVNHLHLLQYLKEHWVKFCPMCGAGDSHWPRCDGVPSTLGNDHGGDDLLPVFTVACVKCGFVTSLALRAVFPREVKALDAMEVKS